MVELFKYSAGSVSFPTSFHHSQIMALIFPPSSPLTYSVTKASSLLINRRTLATTGGLRRSQPHVPELPEPREPRSVLMFPSTTERALRRPRDPSSKRVLWFSGYVSAGRSSSARRSRMACAFRSPSTISARRSFTSPPPPHQSTPLRPLWDRLVLPGVFGGGTTGWTGEIGGLSGLLAPLLGVPPGWGAAGEAGKRSPEPF